MALAMIISMVPFTAMADTTVEPVEPACKHEGGAWTSNGDGTHSSKCECGEYVDGPHACQDLGKGECYMCGYKFNVEPKCDHEGGAWTSMEVQAPPS